MTRLTDAANPRLGHVHQAAELADVLERHGLQPGQMAGLGPSLARRLRAAVGTAPSRQRQRGALRGRPAAPSTRNMTAARTTRVPSEKHRTDQIDNPHSTADRQVREDE
jgi:hypothetical protein